MGGKEMFKGTVDLFIRVPEGTDVEALIDNLQYALALAASRVGVNVFPVDAKNVERCTIEDWAEVAKTEAARHAYGPEDAERINALIDHGVTVINERDAAATQAATV